MNREIVYTFDVETPTQMTKQEAQDMDRAQPWRKRISSGAMEDLNALKMIVLWADKITRSPQNQQLMREMGVFPKARSAVGLLRAAVEGMLQRVSAVQLRTIDANWQVMNITISATKQLPGFVNVDVDDMNTLLRQTMRACQDRFCMEDEKASRTCPVRQALDRCINAGRFAEKHENYLGTCPYCLKDLEEQA